MGRIRIESKPVEPGPNARSATRVILVRDDGQEIDLMKELPISRVEFKANRRSQEATLVVDSVELAADMSEDQVRLPPLTMQDLVNRKPREFEGYPRVDVGGPQYAQLFSDPVFQRMDPRVPNELTAWYKRTNGVDNEGFTFIGTIANGPMKRAVFHKPGLKMPETVADIIAKVKAT